MLWGNLAHRCSATTEPNLVLILRQKILHDTAKIWRSKKTRNSWYLKVVITIITVYSPFIINTLWVSFVSKSQAFPGGENVFLVPKNFASPPKGILHWGGTVVPPRQPALLLNSFLASHLPHQRQRVWVCESGCSLSSLGAITHGVICVLQNQLKSLCKHFIHFCSLFHSSG